MIPHCQRVIDAMAITSAILFIILGAQWALDQTDTRCHPYEKSLIGDLAATRYGCIREPISGKHPENSIDRAKKIGQ